MSFRDPRLETAASEIVRQQLEDLEARYGTTADAPPAGDKAVRWLPFHSAGHAAVVYAYATDAARALVRAGELRDDAVSLVRIAAVFQDSVRELGTGADESASAEAAMAAMRAERYAHLFDRAACDTVAAAILATTPEFDESGTLRQSVDESASAESVLIQSVVADAALSFLGRADGVHRALLLFLERESIDGGVALPRIAEELPGIAVDAGSLQAGLEAQAALFGSHRFVLADSNARLAAQQAENALALTAFADRAGSGASFGELLGEVAPEEVRRSRRPPRHLV